MRTIYCGQESDCVPGTSELIGEDLDMIIPSTGIVVGIDLAKCCSHYLAFCYTPWENSGVYNCGCTLSMRGLVACVVCFLASELCMY